MADSDCIIVHEQVVVPDASVVKEMVALPGEKGDKGDPFTYDDFTPEQIADLQRPATEAAKVANQAAENANKATSDIKVLGVTLTAEEAKRESAESSRASAESERAEAEFQRETSFSQMQTTLEGLISDTNTATSNANTAAGNADNAATAANNSATLANEAAAKANQAAENVDGRVSALEEKASQVYENLAAIESSGETNPDKIYIDGETMQPYIYKGGEFVPFSGWSDFVILKDARIDNEGNICQFFYGKFYYLNNSNTISYFDEENKEFVDTKISFNTYILNRDICNKCLFVFDNSIILPSKNYLSCYSLSTGEIVWQNTEIIYYKVRYCFDFGGYLFWYDYVNKIVKRINIETGEFEADFNLAVLCGDESNSYTLPYYSDKCVIDDKSYFLINKKIFEIYEGEIIYYGEIDQDNYSAMFFANNVIFFIGQNKLGAIDKTNFTNKTLSVKTNKSFDVSGVSNPQDSVIFNNVICSKYYNISLGSIYGDTYTHVVSANMNFNNDVVGYMIQGNKGYVRLPNKYSTIKELIYKGYENISR